jgi:hypothetical protein
MGASEMKTKRCGKAILYAGFEDGQPCRSRIGQKQGMT